MDTFHQMKCLVCFKSPCDPCHIKTRGSGGHDKPDNIIPLCRKHHTEQGQIGWKKFCDRNPIVKIQLASLGWYLDNRGRIVKEENT